MDFKTMKLSFRRIKVEYILLAATILVLAASCKKKLPPIPDTMFYKYYPLKTGLTLIYKADSLIYNGNSTMIRDTVSFQLKDYYASTFKDASGTMVYRVERYRRNTDNDAWKFIKEYTVGLYYNEIQKVENNVRLVKMIFPVEKNKSWNANTYNVLDSGNFMQSKYIAVHQPYSNGTLSFDSTTTVQMENEVDFIDSLYQEEKYAANIGLVYYEHDTLNKQDNGQRIGGYKYRQTLIQVQR